MFPTRPNVSWESFKLFPQCHFPLRWLKQRSSIPGLQTSTDPRPVRNRAARQEVSGRRASEASSVFTATPHRSRYHLSSTSCQHYGESYNDFIICYNVITIEIKCTIHVMRLNHPETIPAPAPPVRRRIVFHGTGPWCQKCWGCWAER